MKHVCQNYRCTQILHTTGKSIERFTRPPSHRLWLAKEKNESLLTDRTQRLNIKLRLVRDEASYALVRAWARNPMNTFQMWQGKERPTFPQMCHQLTAKAKRKNTEYRWKQQSPYLIIRNLKFTEKGKSSQRPSFQNFCSPVRKTAKFTQNAQV